MNPVICLCHLATMGVARITEKGPFHLDLNWSADVPLSKYLQALGLQGDARWAPGPGAGSVTIHLGSLGQIDEIL